MKKILLPISLLAIFAISACATSFKYIYQHEVGNENPGFKITDSRKQFEKEPKILSYNITSDEYGIYRLGDNQISPHRLIYLRDILLDNKKISTQMPEVVVKSFLIHNNSHIATKIMATKALLANRAIVYDPRNTNGLSANIIVDLEVEMEFNSYKTKITKPYLVYDINGDKEKLAKVIKLAMHDAILDIIKQYDKT